MDRWSIRYGTGARILPRIAERYRRASSLVPRSLACARVLRKSGASAAAWFVTRATTRSSAISRTSALAWPDRRVASPDQSVRVAPCDRTFRFVASRRARRRTNARATRSVECKFPRDTNSLLITDLRVSSGRSRRTKLQRDTERNVCVHFFRKATSFARREATDEFNN